MHKYNLNNTQSIQVFRVNKMWIIKWASSADHEELMIKYGISRKLTQYPVKETKTCRRRKTTELSPDDSKRIFTKFNNLFRKLSAGAVDNCRMQFNNCIFVHLHSFLSIFYFIIWTGDIFSDYYLILSTCHHLLIMLIYHSRNLISQYFCY